MAEVAVDRLGDSAERYVRWLRATYPQAGADGLARLAVARLERRAWFAAAAAGPAGAVVVLALQAEVALHVAAAYGHDPRHPDRVPELLGLVEPVTSGVLLAGRLARRILPGAGVLVGVLASRSAVEGAARRALRHYRRNGTYLANSR